MTTTGLKKPADQLGEQKLAPRRPSVNLIEKYAGVFVLVVLFAYFAISNPTQFLSYNNIVGVLGNQAIAGIIALGLVAPLAAGVFDLSVAGVMTVSVVAVTALFQSTNGTIPIWLAVVIVLVGALLVGVINSILVVRLRVDPFIATIGTSSVMIGVSQMIANGTTITQNIPNSFTTAGRASLWGIPVLVFIFAILAVIVWYLFTQTPFGPTVYATGAAREAARLSGIRTNRVLVVAFCISALGAALAGVLFAAQTGSGPPGVGDGYLLGAYASVYLGSTMIRPGRFNVGGLVIAILIIALGVNGLQLAGTPFWITELFQGVALLVAVVLSRLRRDRN
jgi:ribose transport system permease protein